MKPNRMKAAAHVLRIVIVLFSSVSAFAQSPDTNFVFSQSSVATEVAEISIVTIPVNTDQPVIVVMKADAVYQTLHIIKPGCSAMLVPPLKSFKDGIALIHTNQFVIAAQQHES